MKAPVRADVEFDPVSIRPLHTGDDDAVLHCHNAAFAATGTKAPRTAATWHWKYRANPTGRLLVMLATHPHDGVVGVYGMVPMPVTLRGTRRLAAQATDLCVRPEWWRNGEPGLFPRLGRAFIDTWLGTGRDDVALAYGLPVAAWRSGVQHLGYQIVRDWDATFLELAAGAPPRPAPGDLVVRPVARFDADADALFARIEPTLGLATVRDHRYLNWRYADHPERHHVLFECRERTSNLLRGLCVYTTGDVLRPHTSYLVDWLAARDDHATMTALLAAAEQQTQRDGTGLLCSVWNHEDPRFLAMQDHGYRVRGTPWFLAVLSPVWDVVFLREQWYFTIGDSDLL